MTRTSHRVTGLFSSLLILLLVAGTPALLLTIDVTPWRRDWDEVSTLLTSPDDGTLAMLVIGVAAWIAWAMMAWLIAVEIFAAARGMTAPRLPGLAAPQAYAGQLVASAALLFTVGPAIVPAFAAPAVEVVPASVSPAAPVVGAVPASGPVVEETARAANRTPSSEPDTINYTVRRGDSLWKIAQEHLGDGLRYTEIIALNQSVLHGEPDFIDPGLVLRLPHEPEKLDEQAAPPTVETHVVEPGDTLWDVAEAELGDGARYGEILAASSDTVQSNGARLTDPNLIHPGWKLTIPSPNGDVNSPVGEPPVNDKSPVVKPPVKDHSPVVEDPAEVDSPVVEPSAESDSPVVSDDDADGSAQNWIMPGLVGAGALLAGAVFAAVRAHRRTQQRSRRPGFAIAPPPVELRSVEKTVTSAGTPTAEVIDQLDRLLRHMVAQVSAFPSIDAVEIALQSVTLHLGEPAELPPPWSGTGQTWSAAVDSPVGDEDELPPCPLLASVGQSDDGHLWLLNLERCASIVLTGDPERSVALARHLAAELALSPWSIIATVEAIGVAPELSALDSTRFRHHPSDASDTTALLERLLIDLQAAQDDGHGDPEPFRMLLVAEGLDDHVQRISALVRNQTSRSGLAVVTLGSKSPADVVLELTTDSRLRVPHLGLDLAAAGLTSAEAKACAAIVDLTRVATIVPVPREKDSGECQALADQAGALVDEVTEPRPVGEAGDASLLPEAAQRYEAVAATTASDVEQLAPVVPEQTRRTILDADPQLDEDLAAWQDPDSRLPKLTLLGPVTVHAEGDPPEAVAERRAYFTELVTFLALHPAGVSSSAIRDAFGISQSRARTDLSSIRSWFGTSARSGGPHLPHASTSRAHATRGVGGYQLSDVLVDYNLFTRLRTRAHARGADGMTDLVSALELVVGEPFSALRNPGWSWLLDQERVNETAAFAVVDVAHIVTVDALSRGDLERALAAAETGCMAAPYDEVCRLDLAKVAEAEGHDALAEQILDEHVFNRTDDHLPPIDLPKRTNTVISNQRWGHAKRHEKP